MLRLVAHDGFFSIPSKDVEIVVPKRVPEVSILHPRDGYTYKAGQTLRLWGAAIKASGRAVPSDHCVWTLDGEQV